MNREETIALNARFDHVTAQHEVLLDMITHLVKRIDKLTQRLSKLDKKDSDGGPDASAMPIYPPSVEV